MNPRARGRGLLTRGVRVISGRTSIFRHKDDNATLYCSAPATWTLPRIARGSNSISSKIPPRFRQQPPLRVPRHFQHKIIKPVACRSGSSVLGSALKNATATFSGKIDDIGAALSPAKVDVIVVRKRKFEVPRGRRVSEKMWAKFNNSGNRKVTFNPVVEARLVPSKEECYPTASYKAACFFSKYYKDIETRRIKSAGPCKAEWLSLLSETRRVAAEGRKQQEEPQRLRTDGGTDRQGSSSIDPTKDEKNATQPVVVKLGDSRGGSGAGSSVPEAGAVPETAGSAGWRRFSLLLPVDGKDEKRGLFKAAKALGRWIKRVYRVSWMPGDGETESCFDWVTEFPAGSQHDVV